MQVPPAELLIAETKIYLCLPALRCLYAAIIIFNRWSASASASVKSAKMACHRLPSPAWRVISLFITPTHRPHEHPMIMAEREKKKERIILFLSVCCVGHVYSNCYLIHLDCWAHPSWWRYLGVGVGVWCVMHCACLDLTFFY